MEMLRRAVGPKFSASDALVSVGGAGNPGSLQLPRQEACLFCGTVADDD